MTMSQSSKVSWIDKDLFCGVGLFTLILPSNRSGNHERFFLVCGHLSSPAINSVVLN